MQFGSRIKHLLLEEKVPYFFGLLIVIIGVQFNYIIKGIFEVPVIEYNYNFKSEKDTLGFCQGNLVVTNISNGKLIENLQLNLIHSSTSESMLMDPNIDAIPPSSMALEDPTFKEDKILNYVIEMLQPGSCYRLTFKTNDIVKEPMLFFEAKAPVRMMRQSCWSFFLKNHILMNGIMFMLFAVVLIAYSFNVPKK